MKPCHLHREPVCPEPDSSVDPERQHFQKAGVLGAESTYKKDSEFSVAVSLEAWNSQLWLVFRTSGKQCPWIAELFKFQEIETRKLLKL